MINVNDLDYESLIPKLKDLIKKDDKKTFLRYHLIDLFNSEGIECGAVFDKNGDVEFPDYVDEVTDVLIDLDPFFKEHQDKHMQDMINLMADNMVNTMIKSSGVPPQYFPCNFPKLTVPRDCIKTN